jgi:hypothetical protein
MIKLRAKFLDVEIEVETEDNDRAAAYFVHWLALVRQMMADDVAQPEPTPKDARETHH